jgi:hypothetical protein
MALQHAAADLREVTPFTGVFHYAAITPQKAHVFIFERGGQIGPIGFHRLIQRLGETAKMPFPIPPGTCFAMPVGAFKTVRGGCLFPLIRWPPPIS